MAEKDDFMTLLYEKIDENITKISDPDYEYSDPMTKNDWIWIWIIAVICIIGVIVGGFVM